MPHPMSPGRWPRRRAVAALAVGTLAAGALTTTTILAHAATAGCSVRYTVTNQWSGGFGADVTVTNLGDPVTCWALTWTFASGQAVTSAWNATVTRSGSQVTATNAQLQRGAGHRRHRHFGFNGSWNTAEPGTGQLFAQRHDLHRWRGRADPHRADPTASPAASPTPSPTGASPTPTPSGSTPTPTGHRQAEKLDRGLISVRSGSANLVSWRLLAASR